MKPHDAASLLYIISMFAKTSFIMFKSFIFQYLKPKKVDFTPRQKKKGKTNIARKKIIKEVARKVILKLV